MSDAPSSHDASATPADPPSTPTAPPAAAPIDVYHEAELLIRRQFSRRGARRNLMALGFSRADADAAIAVALAPRRYRRRMAILRLLIHLAATAAIAAAATWWNPTGPGQDASAWDTPRWDTSPWDPIRWHPSRWDLSRQALLIRFGLDLGWIWIALAGLAMARWFLRHHGFLVLIVALFRPLRTIRLIVMETHREDLQELELPLVAVALGVALVLYVHHFGQGPGEIRYLDPR